MSEHEWFHDHLTLYSAGGLSADEESRLERHAAECAACAQELAQWRLFDQGLDRLCTPVQFAADWDERVLTKWRVTHKPPRRWSSPARWAAAAAALVFIAALGGAVNTVVQMGLVSFPGGESVQADANLPPMLPVFKAEEEEVGRSYFSSSHARTQSRNELKQIGLSLHSPNGKLDDIDAFKAAAIQNSNSIDFFPPSLGLVVRGESRIHTSSAGGIIGGKYAKKVEGGMPKENQSIGLGTGSMAQYDPIGFGTRLDGAAKWKDSGVSNGTMAGEAVAVPDGGAVVLGGLSKRLDDLQKLQDGEMKDGVTVGLGDGSVRSIAEVSRDVWGHLPNRTKADPKSPSDVRGYLPATPRVAKAPSNEADKDKSERKPDREAEDLLATVKETHTGSLLFGAGVKQDSGSKHSVTILKSTTEYYNPSFNRKLTGMDVSNSAAKLPEPKSEARVEERILKEKTAAIVKNADGLVSEQQPLAIQQKPDPQVAQRKIIRTGDLEFEVDVFDNTVAQITKLIGAIPGAFVMTVNSDRLPNGKVKGSIVVRMPPEHLDKFVLDLRKDLAKTGELKSQRIGSQDVTKQYTDIESRLRAARAMEERLIKIIQNGKGEIKDLVAAERELGVWRTKIEEYEGEIRYYNNQVGLSTLTITAFEKEIRTAAAMVVTEQVTMKIEADDVEKSLQAALKAVTEAKGRVIKSELKQHAAGQLEAVLQFEVAPAAAGAVKDKLKQLGIVTHQDSQRLQQAEGGAAPMGEPIKSRTNDVRFNVTLYNVANIKPRQEFNLQVAVADVAAEYQRLLELVLQMSGQIRVSQLDEKDKTNIFAQLDFDVPTTKRELFDKQLAAVGDVVSRNTTRAGPGETATDRKVGYRLMLKSIVSIPPRETFVLQAYSLDVPVAFKTLHQAALQAKGTVRVTQLNEQDRQNITAQLDFDVPAGEHSAMEKLLDELGEIHSRTTNRVPPNEVATDKKVGYRLTLRSQIPPRETVALGLEVSDVERVAADLANLVGAAKGKVTISQITQDAAGRAVAIQLFDVPLSAKDNLVRNFKVKGKVRAQKITQNLQAPEGKLATAHIDVTLTNLTPIVPADESLWGQVRTSLSYAFRLLSVSLMFVIVGISVILPWALVLWVAVKLVRRARAKGQATA